MAPLGYQYQEIYICLNLLLVSVSIICLRNLLEKDLIVFHSLIKYGIWYQYAGPWCLVVLAALFDLLLSVCGLFIFIVL